MRLQLVARLTNNYSLFKDAKRLALPKFALIE